MLRIITILAAMLSFAAPSFAASWLSAANGYKGAQPVLIGGEGSVKTFVCRVGGIPGKLVPIDGKCYIPYFNVEYAYTSYEVLQDVGGELRFWAGSVLNDSYVFLGGSENGAPLHICRVRTSAGFIGGKLVGSVRDGTCYYGYYGKEYSSPTFDALSDA